jgi:hypothetical protein
MPSMWNDERDRPRRPVAEPEIIPPDHRNPRDPRPPQDQLYGRQRIFVAQPGPVGTLLALVGLAAFAAAGILLFLGLFFFLLPALGVMLAAFVLAALLRGPRRF